MTLNDALKLEPGAGHGFYAVNSYSTDQMPQSIDELRGIMEKARSRMDEYRRKRDEMFKQYHDKGHVIFAADRGFGEEWIVSDDIYDGLFKAADSIENVPFVGQLTGVKFIRLRDWMRGDGCLESFLKLQSCWKGGGE